MGWTRLLGWRDSSQSDNRPPSGPCPTSAPTRPRRRALAVALAMLAAVATLAVPAGAAVAAPEPGQYVPVAPVTVVNNLSLAAGATTTATVQRILASPLPC